MLNSILSKKETENPSLLLIEPKNDLLIHNNPGCSRHPLFRAVGGFHFCFGQRIDSKADFHIQHMEEEA